MIIWGGGISVMCPSVQQQFVAPNTEYIARKDLEEPRRINCIEQAKYLN